MRPGQGHFDQLRNAEGTVLLCLHRWGAHEHATLANLGAAPAGNGFLLFFRVGDYETELARARVLGTELTEELHVNPNTQTLEFSLRDLDGYYVTVSALAVSE